MSTVYKYAHDWSLALDPGVQRKGLWIEDDIVGAGLTSNTDWYSTFVDAGNDGGYPINDGGALIVPYDTGSVIEPRSYGWLAASQFTELSNIDNRYYKRNAGKNEWRPVESVTANFALPFPTTKIYRKLPGAISGTLIYTSGPVPSGYSTNVDPAYIYYADKPISIHCSGSNNSIHSASLKSNMFANYSNRYGNSNFYIWNPGSQNVEVDIFFGGSGINGTAIAQALLNPGEVTTYVGTNDIGWYYFLAKGGDVTMSVEEDSGDRHIMTPACDTIYRRRDNNETNMIGGAPSSIGTYRIQDVNRCVHVEIGDGSGGDSCQGVGLENLSNTYAFNGPLSDYHITTPFTNTVEVFYYDGTGASWSGLNTHALFGSITSPGQIGVDGDGDGSYDDSGAASYLAGGANLWLFKGTKPFEITINDASNDEEPLFGWMENENNVTFNTESELLAYVDTVNDYYRITFPV